MKKSEKNLAHLFKNVIMMSGTPDWVQLRMTVKNPQNVCKCSPKLAMENGWICKPTLSLVNCTDADWPAAVKAVYNREMKVYEETGKIFRPTILVNCGSIDQVANLREKKWFKDNAGKKFHLISIHSMKTVTDDKTNIKKDLSAEIDGKKVEAEEAYNAIMDIDKGEAGRFKDSLPILVFQVQMIGEGINVKSFNAVITASNCDKTAMQQIGRAVRNFAVEREVVEKTVRPSTTFWGKLFKKTVEVEELKKKTFTKVNDGHANVYVINDNLKTLMNLVHGLNNFDLTSDCFSWGKKIDISTGSAVRILDEEDAAHEQKDKWNDISDKDPEIVEVFKEVKKKVLTSCFDMFFDGLEDNDGNGIPDNVEFEKIVKEKDAEGWCQVWMNRSNVSAVDLMEKFRERVCKLLDDEVFVELWKKSREAALEYAVQDRDMAKFLDTHLNEKTFANFMM